jgi:hypothetical protein
VPRPFPVSADFLRTKVSIEGKRLLCCNRRIGPEQTGALDASNYDLFRFYTDG